jgi:hypothetical protein
MNTITTEEFTNNKHLFTFGQDGDMVSCWRNDNFVDPVVSPIGFGVDEISALEDLLENELK